MMNDQVNEKLRSLLFLCCVEQFFGVVFLFCFVFFFLILFATAAKHRKVAFKLKQSSSLGNSNTTEPSISKRKGSRKSS